MKTLSFLISACRYCQHYKPEGRRGGTCQQLGGVVQGSWKACNLAIPVFATSWSGLEAIMLLPEGEMKAPVFKHGDEIAIRDFSRL